MTKNILEVMENKKTDKGVVYERITKERDYQDHMCALNNVPDNPSVEGELVMLKTYIDKVLLLWTKTLSTNNKPTLEEVRKIVAIGVRCLENHGCPERDIMDIMKGNLDNDG